LRPRRFAFPYLLSEFDLYLMGEGRHYDTYEKLGAHIKTVDGVSGVHFAVWAPSARRVSVVGDFNGWDGRVPSHAHARLFPASGSCFSPTSARARFTNTKSLARAARCCR